MYSTKHSNSRLFNLTRLLNCRQKDAVALHEAASRNLAVQSVQIKQLDERVAEFSHVLAKHEAVSFLSLSLADSMTLRHDKGLWAELSQTVNIPVLTKLTCSSGYKDQRRL